ncbi:hypothetical protein ACHAQJ_010283 [Trichoderma viride]
MSKKIELIAMTTTSFSQRWNDRGSGATRDGGFWHPNSQDDFRPLGSVGVPNYSDINGNYSAILIKANPNGTGDLPPVASPTGYTQVWKDEKSGAAKDGSFWRPIPPNGYVALGDVARQEWSPAPSQNDVWCVREDLVEQGSLAANSVWDDKRSGAKHDVSIWEIRTTTCFDTEPVTAEPVIIGSRASHLGAIRANQGYNSPDSAFARVPIV